LDGLTKMPHSVLIADDHPILLNGLRALIEEDDSFEVVATATDGAEALERIQALEPEIAILDLLMPSMSGIEAMAQLHEHDIATHVVVLAATASDGDIHRVVTLGARALLFKESAPEVLMHCLREVAQGGTWFADGIADIVSYQAEAKAAWNKRLNSLTPREMEVVRLANSGRSNKEIAFLLQLSEGTVKVHLNNVFRKLNVSTRAELRARLGPKFAADTRPS
jgi:DNA-binding NarL/FixJ family response regulator